MATPQVESELYLKASEALNVQFPDLNISSDVLGRYFNLLKLPEKALFDAGLVKNEKEESPNNNEKFDIPTATEVDATADLDQSLESSYVHIENNLPSENENKNEEGVETMGPIGDYLKSNDIVLSPREIGTLMYIFSTPPSYFVDNKLISDESLRAYKNPAVKTEMFYYNKMMSETPITYDTRGLFGHHGHHHHSPGFGGAVRHIFRPHHHPPPHHGYGIHHPPPGRFGFGPRTPPFAHYGGPHHHPHPYGPGFHGGPGRFGGGHGHHGGGHGHGGGGHGHGGGH